MLQRKGFIRVPTLPLGMISKEKGGEGVPPGSRAQPQAAAPLAKIRSPANSPLKPSIRWKQETWNMDIVMPFR